jgi:PPM family protein phosphatase
MKSGVIAVEIAACTDVGLVRKNNEDAFLIVDLNSGQLLGDIFKSEQAPENLHLLIVVSDGMGGQLAGEVASHLTVTTLREELMKMSRKIPPYDRIVQAVEQANYKVYRESMRPEYRGMGATVTAALIEGDKVYIAEVGDSRAYLVRNNRIKQVTTDQSLMEVLISRGLISQDEAERSANRGVLLQAIGSKEEVQVAVTSLSLQANDYLLLCSDGLSNKVKSSELLQFINQRTIPQPACQDMIVTARHRGGEDNITALLTRFTGDGLAAKVTSSKITTTLQALSTFDPDRPKQKRRTQRLSSVPANKTLVYPSTVGISAPTRDLSSYQRRDELVAEFERLSYHIDKAIESLHTEMDGMRQAVEWLQQGGALDKRYPEIFAKLKSAESTLEQTKKSITEAKRQFKGK